MILLYNIYMRKTLKRSVKYKNPKKFVLIEKNLFKVDVLPLPHLDKEFYREFYLSKFIDGPGFENHLASGAVRFWEINTKKMLVQFFVGKKRRRYTDTFYILIENSQFKLGMVFDKCLFIVKENLQAFIKEVSETLEFRRSVKKYKEDISPTASRQLKALLKNCSQFKYVEPEAEDYTLSKLKGRA